MKNKLNFKIYIKVLSLFCALCILVGSNMVNAQNDNTKEKQYVIITENIDKTTDMISDNNIEDVCENKKSPDIVVANLTESQAKRIDNKDFIVCVEEDITLTGSFDEEGKKNVEESDTPNQWYLDAIGVEKAEKPKNQVKVALLDSGVSYTDDVDVENSINFVDDTSTNPLFIDGNGHGSAVASVVCAKDNGEGITGVNPNVCLYSAKILDDENKAPLSRVIQGIYWAIDNDVKIINMSFGTTINSQALHDVINQAAKKDILMIAAAGNTKHQDVQYPAAYNEVIAVGSTDTNGELSENSSSGTELELVAPGEKIIANGFLSMSEVVSGTSIATAQVTGVASLLLQKDLSKSADFIRQLLKTSAKEVKYENNKITGLVDYSYANNIYNEFEIKYSLDSLNSTKIKNTEPPKDYSVEAENVEGLWAGKTHESMADNYSSSAGISSDKSSILKEYVKVADTAFPASDPKKRTPVAFVSALHGAGNYVINMEYLWYFAIFLGKGKNPTTRKEMNELISKARNSAKGKISSYKAYEKYNNTNSQLRKLIDNSGTMVKTGKDESSNYVLQPNTVLSRKVLQYRAFAYLIHLIGDVFSHRTMVPSSATVTSDITTFNNSRNGSTSSSKYLFSKHLSPDASLSSFITNVKNGTLQFRDVKSYFPQKEYYEDCVNFFRNRFVSACRSVKMLCEKIASNDSTINFTIFMSMFDGSELANVKLNSLKLFINNCNYTGSSYTEAQWKKCST